MQHRVSPPIATPRTPPTTYPPLPPRLPISLHPPAPLCPYTPLLPLRWLSHIVYYGLKCDSQQRLSAGVPLWQSEGFLFLTRSVRLDYFFGGDTGLWRLTLLPCQWICLRFYPSWSSRPLRWKVNNPFWIYINLENAAFKQGAVVMVFGGRGWGVEASWSFCWAAPASPRRSGMSYTWVAADCFGSSLFM